MKFLVLGAGRMGYAMVYDLIRSPRVEQVIFADGDIKRIQTALSKLSDDKIIPVELDISKLEDVVKLISRCDVCISCVAPDYNYDLAKAALQAGTHFCDLGGSQTAIAKEFQLDDLAKERGIVIMPDLGLAPGLVSILAVNAADSLDELYEIRIRVGAVPLEPEDSVKERQLFSIDDRMDKYMDDATIIRDGKHFQVPSLTDPEEIEFTKPFAKMEAFNTAGGASALAQKYAGKVQHLDAKTIHYPGHGGQIFLLKHLGLLSPEPVDLPTGKVVPRHLIAHLVEKMLKDEPDVVLLRVTVTGVKDRQPIQVVWECIDYSDQASCLSATMRMTAFPASVIAQMIARGDITDRGVLRQETSVPLKLFLAELASRGISLTFSEQDPNHPSSETAWSPHPRSGVAGPQQ